LVTDNIVCRAEEQPTNALRGEKTSCGLTIAVADSWYDGFQVVFQKYPKF